MIHKCEWNDIVEKTTLSRIETYFYAVKDWKPTGFRLIDMEPHPSMMRVLPVFDCVNCTNFPVELRFWSYNSGVAVMDAQYYGFVLWDIEPHGFRAGICENCGVVNYLFFPSGQATFFLMCSLYPVTCPQP